VCTRLGVWNRKCGKLIVAVEPDEVPDLEKLFAKGLANGVEEMEMIDAGRAAKVEPNIKCTQAIYLGCTGIVDSHELMRAYLHEGKEHGAEVVFGVEVERAELSGGEYKILVKERSGERQTITSRYVVNSAGLGADVLAQQFGIDIDAEDLRYHVNRGHYYRVAASKSKLVSRLVYPMPPAKGLGLGIHITVDKGGSVKLGPDTGFVPDLPEDRWYEFDDSAERRQKFYSAVVRYFPQLAPEDLTPDQVGVRPKLQKPGEPLRDFVIEEESKRGLPGLVNLIGIESPGLTCAHEIAKVVAGLLPDERSGA
jgi:L-2-hydroxyglutarate oxidase LhgO